MSEPMTAERAIEALSEFRAEETGDHDFPDIQKHFELDRLMADVSAFIRTQSDRIEELEGVLAGAPELIKNQDERIAELNRRLELAGEREYYLEEDARRVEREVELLLDEAQRRKHDNGRGDKAFENAMTRLKFFLKDGTSSFGSQNTAAEKVRSTT